MLKAHAKTYFPRPLTDISAFQARLDDAFSGRLRIRWSLKEGCWHIEQGGLGHALHEVFHNAPPLDEWYDNLICIRDGYSLVLRVDANTRRACRKCDTVLAMPIRESKIVTCPTCKAAGRDGGFTAGYWPLSECLIDYLRGCDPSREFKGAGAKFDRVVEANSLMELRREMSLVGDMSTGMKDALLEQLPKAGFPSLTLHSWRH